MSYSNLIGDEVYWGSPCCEDFHTIVDVKEEDDNVELIMEDHVKQKSVLIPKQDLDKYIQEEYVEFTRKLPNGYGLEVLISCGEQAVRWAESSGE